MNELALIRKNLFQFRPLSPNMVSRVKSAIEESERAIAKEESYLPHLQNLVYLKYLKSHLDMLKEEVKLAESCT